MLSIRWSGFHVAGGNRAPAGVRKCIPTVGMCMAAEGGNRSAALEALYQDLDSKHIAPFWAIDAAAKHDEDQQVMDKKKAVPFVWKYERDIKPLLLRSAELVSLESSERRSLILLNPGLAPRRPRSLRRLPPGQRSDGSGDPALEGRTHRYTANRRRMELPLIDRVTKDDR